MFGRRRSPDADDPSCGDGGANPSMTPKESADPNGYGPAAPLPSAHPSPSGQPGRSIFLKEESESGDAPTTGTASSPPSGPDEGEDAKVTDKTAGAFFLGPRRVSSPTAVSDSDSDEDDDGDSWVGFSDRTFGGASTSTSSPDAYGNGAFLHDPSSFYEDAHAQILGHSFWRQEHEPCDDFPMVLQTSQNGGRPVYEKEPISSLPDEFAYKVMKDKSKMLLSKYSEYRKVSGDGSCFYRSFLYSYLEQLKKVSPEEELRLLGTLEPVLEKFQKLHWPDSYYDGHAAFVDLILDCMLQKQTLSVSDYEQWLFQESQNEQKFAIIISYLRLVTAIEISSEVEKFRHFIQRLDPSNPEWWCRRNVIPMDKEAMEVHLVALTDVLHVPLRIINIDMSSTPEPNIHNIYESPDGLPIVPCVTLLYRPGHYDIIYQ